MHVFKQNHWLSSISDNPFIASHGVFEIYQDKIILYLFYTGIDIL